MNDLVGRVAVVTGTSPNIGAGIALELGAAGATVVCVDRDPVMAGHVAADIVARGGQALPLSCDATDERAVGDLLDTVRSQVGLPAILVNGVVQYNVKGIREMSLSQWRSQLAVMLDGTFLFTRRVVNDLVAVGRPGSVITLLSTAAHQGEPNNIGYCTAKGGLLNYTRSLAVELAPLGIRCNSLTPTATDVGEWAARAREWGVPGPGEDLVAELRLAAAQVPTGRLPSPSDYGRAAVFLASDAALAITGIDLRVDSGSTALYWRRKPGEDRREGLTT
ncbi:D-threitol dehydrogenase [Acrocarpospora macrocephala]|uniref:D-threitol dehydrogenase n=1 Tax=Acrocarpospora macrocephala TaxID=150177 RepID=A0A5M3WL25_9ACTN|nr:SDR family oxidoreductase [Acrocarpospora macrocephala]GES09594.1 D-threitol dehydrogenase [Acrocarpospora macrocephala]